MLVTMAYGSYWDLYGKQFESMCDDLEEKPDRVVILTDKPVETKYENIVHVPENGLDDYALGSYRQKSLEICDCDWLIQFDIDDVMYPNYISNLNEDVDCHIFAVKYNEYAIMGLDNCIKGFYNLQNMPSFGGYMNSAFKSSTLRKFGGYKTNIGWEDIILMCDLVHNKAKFYIDTSVLRGERVLQSNTSSITKSSTQIKTFKADQTKEYFEKLKIVNHTDGVDMSRKMQIEDLYRSVLNREPDIDGLMFYYNSKLTVDEIHKAISNSDERLCKLKTQFNGIDFIFHTHNCKKDLVVSRRIHDAGSWEPHISNIILNSMKDGGLFIDIGANIGWHSKVVQNAGYDVVAFEPEPENFKLLTQNCYKEGSLLKDMALGDISTTLFLERDPNNYGNTWVSESGTSKATSVRLDDVLNKTDALRTSVVKMDVQGYETKVIQGGIEFFKNLKKGTVIITEVSVWQPKFNLQLFLDVLHTDVTESYALCYWWNSNPVPLSEALEYISKISKESNISEIEGRLEFDLVIVK
jgi:FkbM family methyltransferase